METKELAVEQSEGEEGSPMGREDVHDGARPLVTVDVVIFALRQSDLQVLLVRRRQPPCEELWAIPGGLVHADETLDATATRKLEEATGLTDVYLEQLYTFGDPSRDPRDRVITVAYYAVVPANSPVLPSAGVVPASPALPSAGVDPASASVEASVRIVPCTAGDLGHVRWWSVYALPPLAFDHAEILTYALRRLRYKLEYTAVGFELLPDEFTLTELQTAYEIVLGEGLDKRNFRRKILGPGILEPCGRLRSGEGRPARLYRYREDAVAEVKARRLFP